MFKFDDGMVNYHHLPGHRTDQAVLTHSGHTLMKPADFCVTVQSAVIFSSLTILAMTGISLWSQWPN
jgi:hypothetical protein